MRSFKSLNPYEKLQIDCINSPNISLSFWKENVPMYHERLNTLQDFIFEIIIAQAPPEPINVCQPSPCGPNAQCQISGNSPSCSCLPEFIGSPPYCKPECISNSECPTNLACINQKCRDPCPGSCGANAECRIISHTPMCVCSPGFVGDPFVQCIPKLGKKWTKHQMGLHYPSWNHQKIFCSRMCSL